MTEQAQETDRFVGKLVSDRYRISRKLGEGGMGTVYEAMHVAIEKKIALKILHAQYSASPEVVSRFKQEAISASRIKHQNVIDVFDFGQLGDGSCFIAMEYLDGTDLGFALEKRGHFPAPEAIRIVLQVCRALGSGHQSGVVHRDLKPENIFLTKTPEGDDMVKILDYGIAQLRSNDEPTQTEMRPRRLTKTGMIFGTPEYMAPEQARGQSVDHRSDVYATGVILYELLTGAVPFLGESFLEVLNQHVQSQVPPFALANPSVQLSPELERVVMRALEKDAEYRFPTMKDFQNALLKTPEGRAARARISSIHPDDEDEELVANRIENSQFPPARSAAHGTAMFGSPGGRSASAGAEDVQLPTHSSRAMTVGLLVAACAILAGGGYYYFQKKPASHVPTAVPATEEPSVAATASALEEEKKEPSPSVETAPAPVEPALPPRVVLRVATDPAGAIIQKDGFQVCDASPCEVEVERGSAVTLVAQKGTSRGEAKVLAQKDQAVSIQLVAPRSPAPSPRAPAPALKDTGPALCEVMVDGIKILRPCQ